MHEQRLLDESSPASRSKSDPDGAGEIDSRQDREEDTAVLASVISEQVLPQLIAAGKAAHRAEVGDLDRHALGDSARVDEFLSLLLESERGSCFDYLRHAHRRGLSLESIYLDLLTPAARKLGSMWEDDRLGFVEISIALARLQALIIKASQSELPEARAIDPSRQIVLARARDDEHAFGLLMVAEFFRLGGWRVVGGPDLDTGQELCALVRADSFPVLGISAGSRVKAVQLKHDIEQVRRNSRNADLVVFVGGPAFVEEPELLRQVGADVVATDGLAALESAEAYAH